MKISKAQRLSMRAKLLEITERAATAEANALACATSAVDGGPFPPRDEADRRSQLNSYQVGYLRGALDGIAKALGLVIKHDLTSPLEREKEAKA